MFTQLYSGKALVWWQNAGDQGVQIREVIPLSAESSRAYLLLIAVDYVEGEAEGYFLPLAFASGKEAEQIQREFPALVVARLRLGEGEPRGVLYDAVANKRFAKALFELMARRRTVRGGEGELAASATLALRAIRGVETGVPEPSVGKAEQSNTSILFGDKFILKLFRRIDLGVNPDLEVGRFLTEKGFPNIAAVAGALEYFRPNGDQATLGIMSGFVPASRDAWEFTLDTLTRYFERVRTLPAEAKIDPLAGGPLMELTDQKISTEVATLVGTSWNPRGFWAAALANSI